MSRREAVMARRGDEQDANERRTRWHDAVADAQLTSSSYRRNEP